MTFVRGVFLFAFLMLVIGLLGSKYALGALFAHGGLPAESSVVADAATATVKPSATVLLTPTMTPPPLVVHTATPHKTATPRAKSTATPKPTARPTPSPTPGIVTLSNYWVGSARLHRGQTVAIGYVIDNGTGRTQRIMLGASVKSTLTYSWAGSAVSDPSHDVVAIVPPGVTTHSRYFSVPRMLRPGSYDVAWGLRDAATGRRDALVTASAVLHVAR